jgi:hypothetical protein
MPRLSDTGRRLLERARGNAGLIVPLPRSAREIGAAQTLLRHGLLIEARSQPGVLEWRTDREGQVWCLGISDTGRQAIGWNEPLLPTRSQVVTGRFVKIFFEAHGREPTSIEELETFILAHLRAGWRRDR